MTEKYINKTSVLQKLNNFGMALFIFAVLTGTILGLTGYLHFGQLPVNANDLTEHEDEHETENSELSIAELEEAVCEHEIQTIECSECRYELGVVQLEPSLVDTLLETVVVNKQEQSRKLILTGKVELDKTKVVEVVPTGGGQVIRVEKLLGDKVKQGDILAALHSAEFGQAKAEFLEMHAKLELAKSTYEREEKLYDKKISSTAEYQNALNELKSAQAYYAAAERRLRLFGLETKQIETVIEEKENDQFAELILRAPQAGTIITQNISTGALIDASQSLYTIADISNVWVWYDLYEKDLSEIHEQIESGQTINAKVRVTAFPEEVFDGIIDLIGNQVDEHTRTIRIRVQVKNEKYKLKPGMFTEAEISFPLKNEVLAVPSSSVLSNEEKTFVFQYWKNNLWMRRNVVTGSRYDDSIEIISGIPQGVTIVSGGAFMLKSDILREKMGAGCAD